MRVSMHRVTLMFTDTLARTSNSMEDERRQIMLDPQPRVSPLRSACEAFVLTPHRILGTVGPYSPSHMGICSRPIEHEPAEQLSHRKLVSLSGERRLIVQSYACSQQTMPTTHRMDVPSTRPRNINPTI